MPSETIAGRSGEGAAPRDALAEQLNCSSGEFDPQSATLEAALGAIEAELRRPDLTREERDRLRLAAMALCPRRFWSLKQTASQGGLALETVRRRALRISGAKQAGRWKLTSSMVLTILEGAQNA